MGYKTNYKVVWSFDGWVAKRLARLPYYTSLEWVSFAA